MLGCIGSTDESHVVMKRFIYSLWKFHLSHKLTHSSRTYNLTFDHKRRILSSTSSHTELFNNKTLIKFDEFVQRFRGGMCDNKHSFEFYDSDKDENVIKKNIVVTI